MGGIHIPGACPQRCVWMSCHHCLFCRSWRQGGTLNGSKSTAPGRAHGTEDNGGAPGPSTSKSGCDLVPKKNHKFITFLRYYTLGRAMCQKAHFQPWQRCACFFCVVSCWQCVKKCKGLVKVRGFHCIGGGSVPPPMSCRTLDWAMCQRARRLALVETFICLHALVFGWHCVEKHTTLKNEFAFSLHQGWRPCTHAVPKRWVW